MEEEEEEEVREVKGVKGSWSSGGRCLSGGVEGHRSNSLPGNI